MDELIDVSFPSCWVGGGGVGGGENGFIFVLVSFYDATQREVTRSQTVSWRQFVWFAANLLWLAAAGYWS